MLYTGIRLGVPAARARLRLGHDLLAAAARLESRPEYGRSRTSSCWPGCRPRACWILPRRGRPAFPRAGAEGRPETGPCPAGRGKTGSKHQVIADGHGIPLARPLTGGNRNDVTQLMPLLRGVAPVRGKRGRPRQRREGLHADRGYDHDKYRRMARAPGVKPAVARRGPSTAPAWASIGWVVEQTLRCCTGSAACASAGRSATTSTRPSSPSPAPSSAGDTSPADHSVRTSKCRPATPARTPRAPDEAPSTRSAHQPGVNCHTVAR